MTLPHEAVQLFLLNSLVCTWYTEEDEFTEL